jgi:hypothetical protein
MRITRSQFFASLAGLFVAPKVVKAAPAIHSISASRITAGTINAASIRPCNVTAYTVNEVRAMLALDYVRDGDVPFINLTEPTT